MNTSPCRYVLYAGDLTKSLTLTLKSCLDACTRLHWGLWSVFYQTNQKRYAS